MTSSSNNFPTFAESAKFDSSNWVTWSGLIKITAELRGAFGYLDGSIKDPSATPPPPGTPSPQSIPLPSSPTITSTVVPPPPTPVETPWESMTPSPAEWKTRNAWTLALLLFNTNNAVGLGINIHGSAADAWKSYLDTYQVISEIAIINVETDLRNMRYSDDQDFKEFLSQICMKWSDANALGANINDRSFRTIVLAALP
jgi:hypothetical protein